MATIQSSIQLQDRMSGVLNNITQAMSIMLATCESTQAVADQGVDVASWEAARQAVANASAGLIQYREEMERAASIPAPSPVPAAPTWQSVQTPQVFTGSGAERFAQEYQAADQMAQQLYRTQQEISARARSMRVTPPGMLNEVASVGNRMQMLAGRVQELNNIPVNLRTDRTNNELEALRGKMSQAVAVQGQLNAAMGRMDISAANAAYQKLNTIMDSTERDIRDNLMAQEQFNQSVREGQTAAGGLGAKLKGVAMSLAAAFSVQKVIALSDSVTQTTARLNLMTGSLEETNQLTQKIYESAQRSRTSYLATADVVAKLGQRAGDAFGNTGEIVQFAENLNKQFVIAGASQQEISSASLQLTQALGSGALRGEELNAVFEAAPNVIQTIADYMGVPIGQIRQMASDGLITADIIKNALLNATDEINEKFGSMPMTFGQVANKIQNILLQAFYPVIQAIGQGATFIAEHWSAIEPVFYGVAAGAGALAIGLGIQAAATWAAKAAADGLFMSLLKNPLTWIVLIIGVVVAAIYKGIQAVGGLRIAWLICVNAVKTLLDNFKIAFIETWNNIQNSIDNMSYGFNSFKVKVLNALGDLKVKGLTILQDFINGAIDRINKLIGLVNSVAGTSIELITPVEFATNAALEEQAEQNQRAADLAAQKEANATAKAQRQAGIDSMRANADLESAQRKLGITAAKLDAAAKAAAGDRTAAASGDDVTPEIAGNTGNTAANTAAIADSMDVMDEDLKYMRDAAEQEIVNRFTLAELKVDVNNNNTLKTQTDFDDVNHMLGNVTGEILAAAAEGGYL